MTHPSGLALGLAALLGIAVGPIALLFVIPVLVSGAVLRHQRSPWPVVAVTAVLLIASFRAENAPDHAISEDVPTSTVARATISGMPVAASSSERVTVDVRAVAIGEQEWRDASGRVLVFLPFGNAGISLGDEVLLVWDVTPAAFLEPGYRSFVRAAGADGSATAYNAEIVAEGPAWAHALTEFRRSVATALTDAIPGDAGALAAGIVTGDDTGLSTVAEQAFYRTGTSHITAVSGQNVALLMGVLGASWRPSRKAARVATRIGALVAVWGFVLMVGLEPPALRAATVATLALAAGLAGRRPDPLTLLALTLGGMALWNPAIVHGIGFWLSATASFALCSAIPARVTGVRATAMATARGVMAANIATMPVIIWGFGMWSPASLLANLVIGPVMMVTFPAAYGLALMALVSSSAAQYLAWMPGLGLDLTLSAVHRLAPLFGGIIAPTGSASVLLIIGVPCAVVVLSIGRDLPRWAGIVHRSSTPNPGGLRVLASGAAAGVLVLWLLDSIAF